jgi:hypothetical protein
MGDCLQVGDGVQRHADALLHAVGGRTVILRMAGAAVPGSAAEELGLATPLFQDMLLGPAVFHKANDATKLMVSASAVDALLGSLAYDSADLLFEGAVGVLIDGVLYEITNSFVSQSMGAVYCYWLVLRRPVR